MGSAHFFERNQLSAFGSRLKAKATPATDHTDPSGTDHTDIGKIEQHVVTEGQILKEIQNLTEAQIGTESQILTTKTKYPCDP